MLNGVRCIILLLTMAFLSSCFKGGCNVIPDVAFRTNINRASHQNAFSPGNYAYATGGVRGVIVYNTGNGMIAFDRCSTVNPGQKNQVKVINGVEVVDEASGAKWLLKNGSPTHIAECALRIYRVSGSGDLTYVSN